MTPGGIDLVLDGPTSDADWTVLFSEIRSRWPEAIVERLDENEAFAYRDQEALRTNLDEGITGNDAFIYVIVHDDSVTLVVDPPFEEMGRQVLAALEKARG